MTPDPHPASVDLPSTEQDAEIIVRRLDDESRYVALLADREIGSIDYRESGGETELYATFIEPEFRDRGLAGEFIDHVVDVARSAGTEVIVTCPVASAHIAARRETGR
ncbi:GNAT family N-acetyltransferase [Microbacterium sp. NPDC058345]|uniref:GNAT family N-acetyltransferase n=1 Tax=Microbacterium sp. NPDC058345 TaxID=3346455 RepID=UPI00365BE56E